MEELEEYGGEFVDRSGIISRVHALKHYIIASSTLPSETSHVSVRTRIQCQTTKRMFNISISGRAQFLFISFELLLLRKIVAKCESCAKDF